MREVYREEQKVRQPWIWILVLGILGLFIWGIIQQVVFGVDFGNNPTSNLGLIAFSIIPIGLIYFLYTYKMTTEITSDYIYFKVKYFLKKKISWDEVKSVELIKYKPLSQFGGWGIRYGIKGTAYSVSGKECLLIHLIDNDRKIYLGTQEPDRLQLFLKNINK